MTLKRFDSLRYDLKYLLHNLSSLYGTCLLGIFGYFFEVHFTLQTASSLNGGTHPKSMTPLRTVPSCFGWSQYCGGSLQTL